MATTPVTLDPSTAVPLTPSTPERTPAAKLQGAVSFGVQQDPVKYAKLLRLQQQLGLPPEVSQGNEQQVQHVADVNSIDYPKFAATNPRTTAWASNPGNAAVSGVDELHRLGALEQHATAMRTVEPQPKPSLWADAWQTFKDAVTHPLETLIGADTPAAEAQKYSGLESAAEQTGDPFLKSAIALQQFEHKPLWSPNASTVFLRMFNPQSRNVFSRGVTGTAKAIGALTSPENLGLLATLPLAPEDAGAISGAFAAQMTEGAAAGAAESVHAARKGDYGQAAEDAAGVVMNSLFAGAAGSHALSDHVSAELARAERTGQAPAPESSPYLGSLGQAVDVAAESKLRERAPGKFYEAAQANFAGDASLRIPADQFVAYFRNAGQDPAAVAAAVGSTNYAEAVLSGGDVEVPPADFLSKLAPEHQKGLLPHVVDPETGLTAAQHHEGLEELRQWAQSGGPEQMQAAAEQADAETAATPEWQAVKEDLRQRYVAAGETPEVAETLATKDANAYSNLARNAGMKPNELLEMYSPKVTAGEAPGTIGQALARKIADDFDGAVREYSALENTDGGRILNTDDARELSEHYRADRSRSSEVHEAASKFIKDLYAQKLAGPVAEGRAPLVLFTAGGTGAGKSSSLQTPEGSGLNSKADIIFDTNMNTFASADKKIQQALTSGRDVHIQYTYREPVEALQNGALPRAMRMGRTVPLSEHIKTHVGSRSVLDELRTRYAEDPRVSFSAVDNSHGKGNARAISLDSVPQIDDNGLSERLSDVLEAEHQAGRISDRVRNGFAGEAGVQPVTGTAGGAGEVAGSDGGQPEPRSDEALSPRNFPAAASPDELKPNDVGRVPISTLHLDPSRFQYKMNTDSSGVTNLLKGRTWNEDLAGVISVWRDPADGNTYVVNGHHRFQLARETGQQDVAVRMIGADTAEEARAKGAIQNIAEGRGTAMDAAKFLRDADYTVERMNRMGVSMGEATAANGLALSRLDPSLFDKVVNGKLAEGRAIAIGNATADPAEQEAIVQLIDKAERKGKHITNETVNELARMVKGAGQHQETQDSLFGVQEMTRSLALEKAEISSYIRKEISSEQRTFASVADESKAARLSKVKGQKIDAEANSKIAGDAAMAKELYDRLSVRSGTINDILDRASRELADGGKPNAIKSKAYDDTRAALAEALAGATGLNDRVAGADEGGSAAGEPGSVLFQAKRKQQTDEQLGGFFANMEPLVAERDLARANLERQAMEDRMRSPIRDVSQSAGQLERDSPLFYGSGENPTLFREDENPTLFQGEPADEPRGWFRRMPDGSIEIGKTKIGDLSTFVHEPAHAYLEILGDLAKREGATQWLKNDYRKVLDFLGAKDGEPLTREQHETWARANEQYLREGKAPSEGLRGVFQRFAVWLGGIYKKASDLGVELTPEIRDVFDRMYAAEEGVNRAAADAGPRLFTNPEDAGWTEAEFKRYADENSVSLEAAKAHILGKLTEAATRERTEAWVEEESNVRQAMAEHVDAQPQYKAIRGLRKGELEDGTPLTLNKQSLVDQFGEARVKQLQQLHPHLYRVDGTADAETAAEMHGFTSAEEMMRTLEATPRRSQAIEQATQEYLTAKHGDIRYDGTLPAEARLALEQRRAESLYRELKALRAKASAAKSIQVAPIEAYRDAAHQMIEKKAIADLQPTRFLDASRKYSRMAFDALRKGDAKAAADAKHQELMNHFLFREATQAKEYVGKFEAFTKRALGKTVQGKLGLAGGDYQAQFNKLMFRYGLGGAPHDAPEQSLATWAADLYQRGMEPTIDPALYDESRAMNYRQASVAEVRTLHDALENIRHLAYQELGMDVHGRRVDFRSAVETMTERARATLPQRPTRVLSRNKSFSEKVSDIAQRGDALLMRTERLLEWLDGGKQGPWHDNLWNLAADSQGAEYKLQAEVTKALGDALERMPKEQRAKMLDKVTVPGIDEPVTRHDLISMAFNLGNEGNADRLQKTFLWHGWDPTALMDVSRLLTREEWQFVQDGWDALKPLGQAQADLERRLTGLAPVMVEPVAQRIELADGSTIDIQGGYFPIVMDPKYSMRGATADAGDTAQNIMEAGYGRAATSRGNMKARTGFGGPMQLDYEQVLTQHTAKVIKDITHREFMLAANKLLLDPEVRRTMRETLGEGYEEKMMPWLRTIINDRNGSAVQGLADFSRMMRTLRSNLTLATLSFKISTSLLQWTHAPRMLLSTNLGSFSQAMVDFLAHPEDMTEQIKQLSPNEMASRGDNLDRDIRAVLQGDPGIRRSVAKVGNLSIKYTDHLLSFPLWLSVYRDALKKHVDLPEDEAHYLASHEADSAVRLGLGSGAPKDLPPIMRNNDLTKLMTMFYSFHNGIYGQVRDIGHQYRRSGRGISDTGKLTYGLALSVLVPAVLSSLITGNGPSDDENKGSWSAKKALLFAADTVPLLRDVATASERQGDVKFTPLMDVLSKGTKATQQALSDDEEKDWMGIGLNYLEVAGDLGGVPGTTQAMKPVRYHRRAQAGEIENPNVWDAFAGSAHK